jgi:hypothetical protein
MAKRMQIGKTVASVTSEYDGFIAQCRAAGLPVPDKEFVFDSTRSFRFDYAWPYNRIALEIEGGIFGRGKRCPTCKRPPPMGHSSVKGILRDIEKYNLAVCNGWRLIRATSQMVESGAAVALALSLFLRNGDATTV